MIEDTYFLNPEEALRVAQEQNRWGENDYFLQACYYEGELIDSSLPNLIYLPLDNMLESLVYGVHRVPTKIDFTGLELSNEIQVDILLSFNHSIEQVKMYRKQLNNQYYVQMKNAKPDFNEKWRFYLSANSSTQVMQHVSKNIASSLQDMGFEVLYHLYYGTEDIISLKVMSEFKPHATINLNHMMNEFLSDEIFNFVWFQDMMPVLENKEQVLFRKRDYIFYLIEEFQSLLQEKGIEAIYQPFCINTKVFKERPEIKQEKKIVYIGNSYFERLTTSKDLEICEALIKVYDETSFVDTTAIKEVAQQYNETEAKINYILSYVEKDTLLLKLAALKTPYTLEVYGFGWEHYEELKPFFKGKLEYGEEVSKVYNSATYAFTNGSYVLQQRTLEAAASGAIPLVYDTRGRRVTKEEEYFESSFAFFKSMDDLQRILEHNVVKKDFETLVSQHSFEKFTQKMVTLMKNDIKNS